MEDIEDIKRGSLKSEPKSKVKSPKIKSKNTKAAKRKRTASEDERNGDVSTQDPDDFTFSDFDVSRIKTNTSFDGSLENGILSQVYENNEIKEEDGYGKFQQYNKDKLWKLAKLPHHFLPSFNLTQCTELQNLRDYPLLRTSLPHSVYTSSLPLNKIDICHKRTIAQSTYMFRAKALQSAYFKAKKKKRVRKDEKHGIYDKIVVDFMKLRDCQPDKFFERDYDFYYTGGNMCVNGHRVLHTSGNNMDCVNLSLFHVDDKPTLQTMGVANIAETHEDESEVFEMQFSKIENVFFLRRKHSISIIEHTNDTFNSLNTLQSKTIPVISFSACIENPNILAITNLSHQLRLYDVENSKATDKYKLVPKHDVMPSSNWNMIRSFDRNVYIYAACRKLTLIDTRVPQVEWQSNYCGFDEQSPCSTFCSLAVSNFDGLFYVGSNHKAYCVDQRYMGKNIEHKNTAVSRWTHQMSSYPLMMAVNQHEDNEYVVLQSAHSPDLRICENMRFVEEPESKDFVTKKPRTELPLQYNYKSPCLPYMPDTFENILREARMSGACVKPDTGVASRLRACNTGLSFVGRSSNPYILTATSNGDVFARHMYSPDSPHEVIDEASAFDVMSEYEASIKKSVTHPRLAITDICDFSGINKVFRCAAFSDTKPDDDAAAVPKRKYLGRWQKSYNRLCRYKDALVNDLLAVWDIEETGEKNLDLTDIFQNTSTNQMSLVSSWLNSTQGIKSSTMINMTSIHTESFNDTAMGIDTLCETMTHEDTAHYAGDTSAFIVAKPKEKSKKKNRYVKGF